MIQVQSQNLNLVRIILVAAVNALDVAAYLAIAFFHPGTKWLGQTGVLNPAPGCALARLAEKLIGDHQEVPDTEEMLKVKTRGAVGKRAGKMRAKGAWLIYYRH